ncbi:MAG TPA: DUF1579 domain-containing protein [Phycisphaerales bacterium]|nr:DUF1579 domain-containing protein [Phycisphaerales bacterium]
MGCCFGRTGVVALCAAGIAGAAGLGFGLAGRHAPDAATVRTVAQPEDMDMAQMMEAMKKLGTPGKPHEQLAQLAGTWKAEAKFWMGPEPTVEQGRCVYEVVLGGRFLRSHYTMSFMGEPFEGIGFLGYDNLKREYVSVWFDTMSTGAWIQTGHADEAGTTITIEGVAESPMGESPMRNVWKIESKDRHMLEFHEPDPENPGEWHTTGVITYTRER